MASVKALPDKQCASDPLPTWLLEKCVGVISPFLCQLFNWSLEHGSVLSSFKCAYITPLLKKADLDPADVKSYRPISNLSVVSKLLERLVSSQLVNTSRTMTCFQIFSRRIERCTRRKQLFSRY